MKPSPRILFRNMKYLPFLILFFLPFPALAALTLDTPSSANTTSAVTTAFTYAHNCTGNMLIVGISEANSGGQPLAGNVTFNGVSMTMATTSKFNNVSGSSIWYLASPAQGSNNVSITPAASQWLLSGAVCISNAAATIGASKGSNIGNTVSSISTSLTTSVAGAILIDDVYQNNKSLTMTPTGIKLWGVTTTDGEGGYGSYVTTTSPGSYSIGWSESGNGAMSQVALEIDPASAAPTAHTTGYYWLFDW